jgi:hypothetical protein
MRLCLMLCVVAACEGPAGPAGTDGSDGSDGADGSDGDTGPKGDPGTTPPAPWLVGDRVDIAVSALTFDTSGAHVAFTLKDKDGKPLDRTGMLTDGKVTVSFVLAQLGVNADGSPAQYSAYTKRTAAAVATYPNPALPSAEQATTEGVETSFKTVDVTKGTYEYTFTAPATAYDATKTQSVLAIAARTVDGVQSFDRTSARCAAKRSPTRRAAAATERSPRTAAAMRSRISASCATRRRRRIRRVATPSTSR